MKGGTMLTALMASGILKQEDLVKAKEEKKTKACLNCGKEHEHNNSYCSSWCAKLYKENNNAKNV